LVYAICKEGSPENRKKTVALAIPAMESEVRKKSDFAKSVTIFFIIRTWDERIAPIFSGIYMTRVPERSKWVQEAGKIVLAQNAQKK